jgi:hypothetical protein
VLAALALAKLGTSADAASYAQCIAGYNNVTSAAYASRFQADAAAWAVKCPENWADKYRQSDDDEAMMSDPCYSDPPICSENLGITPTYIECSAVAADSVGTPDEIARAEQIATELQNSHGHVCHFAQ